MTNEEAIIYIGRAKKGYSDIHFIKAFDKAIEVLEKQPKQGKWIEIENDVCYRQICSECKKRIKVCIEVCGGENNVYGQSKFCPNCGADMRGKSDDE